MGHDPAKYPLEKIRGRTGGEFLKSDLARLFEALGDDDSAVRYWQRDS